MMALAVLQKRCQDWGKHLPYKDENLCVDSQNPYNKVGAVVLMMARWATERGKSMGIAGQLPSKFGEVSIQWKILSQTTG